MASIDQLSISDWRQVDLELRGNLLRRLDTISGSAARLVTVGRLLLSVKADLKHGLWGGSLTEARHHAEFETDTQRYPSYIPLLRLREMRAAMNLVQGVFGRYSVEAVVD